MLVRLLEKKTPADGWCFSSATRPDTLSSCRAKDRRRQPVAQAGRRASRLCSQTHTGWGSPTTQGAGWIAHRVVDSPWSRTLPDFPQQHFTIRCACLDTRTISKLVLAHNPNNRTSRQSSLKGIGWEGCVVWCEIVSLEKLEKQTLAPFPIRRAEGTTSTG